MNEKGQETVQGPFKASGGTIRGYPLDFGIWIRDDGWPPIVGHTG